MNNLKKSFNRFTLNQKILTLILIEIVGLGIVTIITLTQLQKVGGEVDEMADVTLPLSVLIENIRSKIHGQSNYAGQVIISGAQALVDEESRAAYIVARTNYINDIHVVPREIMAAEQWVNQSQQPNVNEDTILSIYIPDLLQTLFGLRQHVNLLDLSITKLPEQIQDHQVDAIDIMLNDINDNLISQTTGLNELTAMIAEIREATMKHAIHAQRIATGIIVLTAIFAIIFFIAGIQLVVKMNIAKPLQLLTDTINAFTAMQKVEESEFETQVMQRKDELGRMSRSFNRLKHDLWLQGQDLNDAKEEAERANRAKSMFLATASHDLRQPLHAMQMYIEALRQKVGDQQALKIIDDIDSVSISTAKLLSALLDVSQLEAGAIKPYIEDFPITEVLQRIARAFAPVAAQKDLDFEIVQSSVYVRSDPVLLERILGNFISNAIRYTPKGRVLVGVRRRKNKYSIEVHDTGYGIPENEADAIFDDFHQIGNDERDRSKGLGLGLAIAKRLSDRLSHKIECDSIVGQGSRFAVLVSPGKKVANRTDELRHNEEFFVDLSGLSVLLVEDDPEVMKSTQQLISSWGCSVLCARNMDEVQNVLSEQKNISPDILIADKRLPGGVDGMEVATRVQLICGEAIPTLIITGDVEKVNAKEIADRGYQVLYKPLRPAKLRAIITHLIRQRGAHS